MPKFTVTLAAHVTVKGMLIVKANSQAEAIAAAIARADQASWPCSDDGDVIRVSENEAFVDSIEDDDHGLKGFAIDGQGMSSRDAARLGERLLRSARDLFKVAGSERTLDRIRLAITSAGGAIRHATGKGSRA